MPGRNLSQRPQPLPGTRHAAQTPDPVGFRKVTRALVLIHDPEQTLRLQGMLSSLGVDVWEARSASGAAAVLRREEARGVSFDLLLVDGRFGGICGMSLCAALCIPLEHRPEVILQTPTESPLDGKALARSGIGAVIDPEFSRQELHALLHGFHLATSRPGQERLTPAGRVTF